MLRAYDRIIDSLAWLSALIVMFMAVSISCDVVMRYFFSRPLPWIVEITEYLQLYLTFLAASWVLKRNGHVRVEVFVGMLGSRLGAATEVVVHFTCAALMLVLAFFSSSVTLEAFALGLPIVKTLEIPKWIILLPIPVGYVLLFFGFARKGFQVVTRDRWSG